MQQQGSVEEMIAQLEPLRKKIQPADHLLLVNTPGLFVRAQFMQEILRIVWDAPQLKVDVLTMMPGQNGTLWSSGDAFPVMGAGVQAQWLDEQTLQLKGRISAPGQPRHRIMEDGLKQFEWMPLKEGKSTSNQVFEARVVAADAVGATALDFTFFQPLENPRLLIWKADCSDLNAHPWDRRKSATVDLGLR